MHRHTSTKDKHEVTYYWIGRGAPPGRGNSKLDEFREGTKALDALGMNIVTS